MLGTNDVFQGRTLDAILAAYTRIVELSRASNPSMKIIVRFFFFFFFLVFLFPSPPLFISARRMARFYIYIYYIYYVSTNQIG